MEIRKLFPSTVSRREMCLASKCKQEFHKVCPFPVSSLCMHEKNMENMFLLWNIDNVKSFWNEQLKRIKLHQRGSRVTWSLHMTAFARRRRRRNVNAGPETLTSSSAPALTSYQEGMLRLSLTHSQNRYDSIFRPRHSMMMGKRYMPRRWMISSEWKSDCFRILRQTRRIVNRYPSA